MMTRAVTTALSGRTRWPARTTLAVAATVISIAGTALVATPKAHAAGPTYPQGLAVESSTNTLASIGFSSSLAMWPGTSPSIAFVLENPSNGTTFQTAFEGSNGDLWTTGPSGPVTSTWA